MNELTYDVKIWATRVRNGKRGKVYEVRWAVAKQARSRGHSTIKLAESFRSSLITASRQGRAAFADADALPTADLLDRLKDDPEAPWATYGNAGLSAMKLGQLLRDFDITSRNMRLPNGQAKGYGRADFADAWARYCPTEQPGEGKASQPSQASQCRSARDGLPTWDGLPPTPVPAVCITCRHTLTHDDGTHTHPTCATDDTSLRSSL